MTGRHLFWILLALLGTMLVWQGRQALGQWRASRILNAVETMTKQRSQRGGVPRQMADAHLRLLKQVTELNPALVDAPVSRGVQYLVTGRPQGAIRAFEEALALEPRDRIYANLGEAYLEAGRPTEARQALDRALVLDPRLRKELEGLLERVNQ